MLRIGITGRAGQLAQALAERGQTAAAEIVTLARPSFDLLDAAGVARAIEAASCQIIVNAAAYTNVDGAESEPDLAMAINAEGARHVARAAARLSIPVIQISTDYVFDGCATRPCREDDNPTPLSVYGKSKLAGEQAVREASPNHVIVRTAWLYSATGSNFVRLMLQLGETRSAISVVADQYGSPTYVVDLADTIVAIAAQLVLQPGATVLRGVFHAAGTGEASRAELAEAVFGNATKRGRAPVHVDRIATKDYPTAARRPANSRLDSHKLETIYGLKLPEWRQSLDMCLDRLLGPVADSSEIHTSSPADLLYKNTFNEGR